MAKTLTGLNEALKLMDGADIVEGGKPLTYGLLLSNLSGQGQSTDPIRGIIVGLQLRAGDTAPLEDADVTMVKTKLGQVAYGDLVKGQLSQFLELGRPLILADLMPKKESDNGKVSGVA